ncbi:hypothetical protein C8035_v005128 [Colletotrichum spinosum]|uniref:Uncharacterized protein n=1 Tax=Colletotrichum spinosum TaxID=1347390 RepID=A0A4R8QD43_9PEZI|nr:hypothetical protein C8035_v005128 [Colletotrichum spinosum]
MSFSFNFTFSCPVDSQPPRPSTKGSDQAQSAETSRRDCLSLSPTPNRQTTPMFAIGEGSDGASDLEANEDVLSQAAAGDPHDHLVSATAASGAEEHSPPKAPLFPSGALHTAESATEPNQRANDDTSTTSVRQAFIASPQPGASVTERTPPPPVSGDFSFVAKSSFPLVYGGHTTPEPSQSPVPTPTTKRNRPDKAPADLGNVTQLFRQLSVDGATSEVANGATREAPQTPMSSSPREAIIELVDVTQGLGQLSVEEVTGDAASDDVFQNIAPPLGSQTDAAQTSETTTDATRLLAQLSVGDKDRPGVRMQTGKRDKKARYASFVEASGNRVVVTAKKRSPLDLDHLGTILSWIVTYATVSTAKNQSIEQSSRSRLKVVQALRLTCKRLCEVASPLLLPQVSVSLNADSLDRLEKFAQNTDIARGITHFRMNLAFYSCRFMSDPTAFMSYQIRCLELRTERLDRLYQEAHEKSTDAREVKRLRLLKEFHHRQLSGSISMPTRVGFRDYERQYRLQKKALVGAGKDYHLLADKLARLARRMPNLESLELTDMDIPLDWEKTYRKPGLAGVRQHFAAPMRWEKHDIASIAPLAAPMALLVKLPVAFARHGVLLKKLDISVSPSWHDKYSELQSEEADRRALAQLENHLQEVNISFSPRDHDLVVERRPLKSYDVDRYSKQITAMASFLKPFLSSTLNSTKLRLCGKAFSYPQGRVDQSDWPFLLNLVDIPEWSRLKRLKLDHFYTPLSRLTVLLGNRPAPLTVKLDNVTLVGGTWRQALDELRRKRNRWDGSVFVESLSSPREQRPSDDKPPEVASGCEPEGMKDVVWHIQEQSFGVGGTKSPLVDGPVEREAIYDDSRACHLNNPPLDAEKYRKKQKKGEEKRDEGKEKHKEEDGKGEGEEEWEDVEEVEEEKGKEARPAIAEDDEYGSDDESAGTSHGSGSDGDDEVVDEQGARIIRPFDSEYEDLNYAIEAMDSDSDFEGPFYDSETGEYELQYNPRRWRY